MLISKWSGFQEVASHSLYDDASGGVEYKKPSARELWQSSPDTVAGG